MSIHLVAIFFLGVLVNNAGDQEKHCGPVEVHNVYGGCAKIFVNRDRDLISKKKFGILAELYYAIAFSQHVIKDFGSPIGGC